MTNPSEYNHPIPQSALTGAIAILGTIGSGKSYAAKSLVEQLVRSGKRVCVIDPGGDWWGLRSNAAGDGEGVPIAVLGGDHGDVEITPESGEEVGKFIASSDMSCVIDVSAWYKSDQLRFMFDFSESVYKHNRRALHFILEEADQFMPQSPMGEGTKLLNRLDIIVRRGRKYGFRVMLITQRPAVVHKNALTQCSTLVVMKLTSPQDKKAIDAWITDNASTAEAKRLRTSMAKLKLGDGWVYCPGEGLLERVTFPMITTFDSGRTPEDGEEVVVPVNPAEVDMEALTSLFAPENEEVQSDDPHKGKPWIAVGDAELKKQVDELHAKLSDRVHQVHALNQEVEELRMRVSQMGATLEKIGALAQPYIPQAKTLEKQNALARSMIDKGLITTDSKKTAPPPKQAGAKPEPDWADDTLTPAQKQLLGGWVALYPFPATRKEAVIRAGMGAKSSALPANHKALINGGWLARCEELGDGYFKPTRRALELNSVPVLTAEASLEKWCAALPPSLAAMLRALDAHGGPMLNSELAVAAGISPTSSGLGAGLKKLADAGLIVRDNGQVSLDSSFSLGDR